MPWFPFAPPGTLILEDEPGDARVPVFSALQTKRLAPLAMHGVQHLHAPWHPSSAKTLPGLDTPGIPPVKPLSRKGSPHTVKRPKAEVHTYQRMYCCTSSRFLFKN